VLDNLYLCANSINHGKYAYNNLAAYYLTWYHKINSSWHTATESWYQYEKQTPKVLNPAAMPRLETNANGAVCATAVQLTCFAPEWAVVNYLEKELSKRNYLSIRNEYMDDMRGQRTGRTRLSREISIMMASSISPAQILPTAQSHDCGGTAMGRSSRRTAHPPRWDTARTRSWLRISTATAKLDLAVANLNDGTVSVLLQR
jgi:hypothetical protein